MQVTNGGELVLQIGTPKGDEVEATTSADTLTAAVTAMEQIVHAQWEKALTTVPQKWLDTYAEEEYYPAFATIPIPRNELVADMKTMTIKINGAFQSNPRRCAPQELLNLSNVHNLDADMVTEMMQVDRQDDQRDRQRDYRQVDQPPPSRIRCVMRSMITGDHVSEILLPPWAHVQDKDIAKVISLIQAANSVFLTRHGKSTRGESG